MTFKFDYSETDIEKCILKTEENIRNLIYEVMNPKYGYNWELNHKVGFSESEIKELKRRKNREKKQFENQRSTDRLLDYSYILELKRIIDKNWSEFTNIFPSRETTLLFLNYIGKFRNPVMHRRIILRHQTQLCVGMCGELVLHIERWKSGFKRQTEGFHCVFSFSAIPTNEETEEELNKRANEKAESWISGVEKLSSHPTDFKEMKGMGRSGEVQCKSVKLKEGIIYIGPPYLMGRYDGDDYYDSIVNTYFHNAEILDLLISRLHHPYWDLRWLLKEPIDFRRINAERYQQSKETLETVELDDMHFEDHVDARILDNFNDLPMDGVERMRRHEAIRIIAGHSYLTGKKNSIGLLFEGRSENSFFRAHSIFSPDSLIAILLDELPLKQIRKMIKDARSVPPDTNL